jgi:hypothetical protein
MRHLFSGDRLTVVIAVFDSGRDWLLRSWIFIRDHWRYVHDFWHARSFSDRITIFLIPFSVAAVWLAYAAHRHARRVARASGVFAKPEPRILLFGKALDNSNSAIDLWCLVHPGKIADGAVYPLPFVIENHGDRVLRNAIFTFSSGAYGVLEDQLVVKGDSWPAVLADEFKRAVGPSEGAIKEASHRISDIPSKHAGIISELVRLIPTIDRPYSTKRTLPDGRRITLNFSFDIVVLCKVRLFSEDIDLKYSFNIAAMCAPSLRAARDVIAKKRNSDEKLQAKWKRIVFIKPKVLEHTLRQGRHKVFVFKPGAEVELLDVKYR